MNKNTAINIENLSKVYRIGGKDIGDKSFLGSFVSGFTSIGKNLKNLVLLICHLL